MRVPDLGVAVNRPPTRVEELEGQVANLRLALVNRASIDQAKGMLMLRYGMSADTAFEVLRRRSSETNTKIAVLARQLTESAAGHDGGAVARLDRLVTAGGTVDDDIA